MFQKFKQVDIIRKRRIGKEVVLTQHGGEIREGRRINKNWLSGSITKVVRNGKDTPFWSRKLS